MRMVGSPRYLSRAEANRVAEAYTVAGPHDIVLKLKAEKFEKVAEAVTQKLHKIGGVKNTLTLFAFG